jgi:hypothetical protein
VIIAFYFIFGADDVKEEIANAGILKMTLVAHVIYDTIFLQDCK